MPRKLRIDHPDACHHIVVKGHNNGAIFRSNAAKNEYIGLIKKYLKKHDVRLFAYIIMDNHIHMLIQSGKPLKTNRLCISDFMHDVQAAFAKWFNKKKKRTGAVFNGRFWSFTCGSFPYFFYIIDYIHRNALKHKKTKSYNYRYSSFANYTTGKGICDIDACCEFLGISKGDLLGHLEERMVSEDWPILNKLLKKLRDQSNNQTVKEILMELDIRIEELRSTRLENYFSEVQLILIRELNKQATWTIRKIAELFDVSTSFIYQRLKSIEPEASS